MHRKDIKRIFFGFVLIFLAVFSLAVALYWPEFQKQFFPEMTVPRQKNVVPAPVSAPVATPVARDQKESIKKEGLLWVDPASAQYVVTLGKTQGIWEGKKLKVYDGTDLLGQVIVDRALETVSYVVAEKSADISKDTYYRVVAE
ncbi:MAG: hypothetical protein A2705_04590 [Omnitrophica WOR_2 bacterium RIFCSPHIGHO2_01_FULL_52_10]|nr:MAG: hypothetical protein A2705_04590 [Omnitrophica WOR_2 bacterium RIFCSPHIGHO2_01_FULL_52_10]